MNSGIVSTILDRCKRCYSCIRECPAKAIQVINGQAAVVAERCITCGHCVKVCSQEAKRIESDMSKVFTEIIPSGNSIAIVAPSFAASFPDSYFKVPSAIRELGFKKVVETAFGADLISSSYVEELKNNGGRTIISSSCPAVVSYIEKYYGGLVPSLAKVVSPMAATGKYLKEKYGHDKKIVFIGPCIAKKSEAVQEEISGIIDAVITFSELKDLFALSGITIEQLQDSEFDPPHAYMGKSYPLAGGLLKTAGISDDILEKEIIVVEGKNKVIEIIDEISNNHINAKFIDILFCEGCISGPAIDSSLNYYSRREKVIKYIEQKIHATDKQVWKSDIYNSRNLDLSREFAVKNQRRPAPTEERIKEILAQTNKTKPTDELNCGACGYSNCREYAAAIAKGLAETEMCLPFLIDELNKAYNDLNTTQDQLRTAEKLASIGQLAAGVAHEINNPLGTILLYSSMLKKEFDKDPDNQQKVEDLELVVEEANRCKNIVSNLLNFARQGKLKISDVNMVEMLADIIKAVRVNPAYKGLQLNLERSSKDFIIDGDADQLKQVFLNIINNACESMEESEKKNLDIKMFYDEECFVAQISDTGCGVSKENYNKLFTPFFTTKKIGRGTGLGLPISYGIVKMHNGHITFQSEIGKGTTFIIKLPTKLNAQIINEN